MSPSPLTAESLSQVQPVPIHWLWERYLPRGKLAILDGDPGVGKSLLTLDLAARLSRGGPLPDGTPSGKPHVTLFLSGEDSAADTIRPRAEAAGADLDRIGIVAAADRLLMRFPADIIPLASLIRERRADLVVIDPIMAFLSPEVAANTDQCVRGPLSLFALCAAKADCTILLVRHLRKQTAAKALHRGLGSVGIIGAVRSGLLVAAQPDDPERRVLAVTKTNLARTPPALGFRVCGDDSARVAIEWTGPVEVSADALGLPMRVRDRAVDWLHRQLADGPRRAAELFTAAAETGIPEATLKRAKLELDVRSHRVQLKGMEQVWYWYDPNADWPKTAPFKRPCGSEALEELL